MLQRLTVRGIELPTETLFFLWFIILAFIASLLWAWYRFRAKANKRPSKATDWSVTSTTPEGDPASPQVAQSSEEASLSYLASHVGITVELAEGTRLRLTIEAIPAM